MGSHRWELRHRTAGIPPTGRRFRALAGRGVLLCLLTGVLVWIAVSLFFRPDPGQGTELGRVELGPSTAELPPERTSGSGASPAGASVPGSPPHSVPGSREGEGTPVPGGGVPAPEAGGNVVVHVAGAVRKPGVYTFPEGTRADAAVKAAGGLARDAEASAVNLASFLADGQQLYIPAEGEGAGARAAAGAPAPAGGGAAGQGIDVNAATSTELEELPGVGPALAGRIVDFRDQNGPFASLAELDAVSGIGPAMVAKLDGLVVFR